VKINLQWRRKMAALQVTDATFEEEVVDCWAEWCAPCRMVGPIIEKLAEEYAGKFKITKLDVDNNREASAKYSITSIPTMLIFVNGEVVDGLIGAHPEANIKAKLDEHLAK
jgi:thioredoxin 1